MRIVVVALLSAFSLLSQVNDGGEHLKRAQVKFDGGWYGGRPHEHLVLTDDELSLHSEPPAQARAKAVDVHLIFDETEHSWTGLVRHGEWSRRVKFTRAPLYNRQPPIGGIWASTSTNPLGCLHVVEGWVDGSSNRGLRAWLDRDWDVMNTYGQPIRIATKGNRIFLTFDDYPGAPYVYTGSLSENHSRLSGAWNPGLLAPNDFVRPSGSECLSSLPLREKM
jgi:hypothetical protein